MVSPACLKRVRGLGGAGIATGAGTTGSVTGAGLVFITTGSLGATMRRTRFLGSGFVSGMGSGSNTTGSATGVTGSSNDNCLPGRVVKTSLGPTTSFLFQGNFGVFFIFRGL